MPQVQASGVVSFLPLSGGARLSYFCVEGQVCQGAGKDPLIAFWQVSEGYFDAVKTPLLEGRLFNANDKAGGLPVTIINQTAAKHFWPNQNPLGKHIVGSRDHIAREVVGVVADMKFTALNSASVEQLYVPVEQMAYPSMTLLVRSSANPSILVPAVRAKIAELDRNLPISNISSMENIVKDSVAQPRMITRFVSLFAAFAMLLATIGIYGVMAYSVAMRTREMGIRMSLGASQRDILKFVIGQGMQLAGIGLVIGVLLSLAAGRLVSSLLFGIHATDPRAFGTAAAVLMLTSLCACYAPARRAIRVNPIVALREE